MQRLIFGFKSKITINITIIILSENRKKTMDQFPPFESG